MFELDPPKFTRIKLPVDDVTVPTKVKVKLASTSKPPLILQLDYIHLLSFLFQNGECFSNICIQIHIFLTYIM